MSRDIHFIIIGSQKDLHSVHPYAYLHMSEHTDPDYFIHIRTHNISEAQSWDGIIEEFGYEPEARKEIHNDSLNLDNILIQMVTAHEAMEWLRESEVYKAGLDLHED
jgi:hypothetical protein